MSHPVLENDALLTMDDEKRSAKLVKHELSCPECRGNPAIIEDHKTGDRICGRCGIIVQARFIDEHTEWRTFSDSSNKSDPSRVGGPMNDLLFGGGMSTTIGDRFENDLYGLHSGEAVALARLQSKGAISASDKYLMNAYKEIGRVCDRLDVGRRAKDQADMFMKKLEETRQLKGRLDGAVAAVIMIACTTVGQPRSFREMDAVSPASKKEIGRCYKHALRFLDLKVKQKQSTAESFVGRFCSMLDLKPDVEEACKTVAHKAADVAGLGGKNPTSVAGACIFLVSSLSRSRRSAREIAAVAGVTEGTLRTSYRELYLKRHELVPKVPCIIHDINTLPE